MYKIRIISHFDKINTAILKNSDPHNMNSHPVWGIPKSIWVVTSIIFVCNVLYQTLIF